MPISYPLVVANIDTRNLIRITFDDISIRGIPNDFLRGFDDEMVSPIVDVHEDCGCVLLRINRLHLCHIAFGGFEVGDVGSAGDKQTCLAVCLVSNFPPMIARVMVIVIAVEIAPDVTHFVEERIAELLHRHLIEIGYLDEIACPPPTCLTKLTAGIVKDEGDFRHIVVENLAVELLVPSLKLRNGDLHSEWIYGYTIVLAKAVPN